MRVRIASLVSLSFLTAFWSVGCGYSFQNSRNPLLEKEGIRRVYVNPVRNNTYKAGVENLVYNALLKTLVSHRKVVLVQDPELADGIIQGTISSAAFSALSFSPSSTLNPAGTGGGPAIPAASIPAEYGSIYVASEYNAHLECSFSLIRRQNLRDKKGIVWSASFARDKAFPSANQLGSLGNTAALINDSEFDRALNDLANSMMADVHESMLAMF